jgi:hypothetical protein
MYVVYCDMDLKASSIQNNWKIDNGKLVLCRNGITKSKEWACFDIMI